MALDPERQANFDNWQARVPVHLASKSYAIDEYLADPERLSGTVQFDRHEVGDVSGKSLLHLQCHIGTDTLSWARLGARVTGVDFSPRAAEAARELFRRSGSPGRFVVSELYESLEVLREKFDVVYTGVGALCWLPDVAKWAQVVSQFLRPSGLFYVREGHPALWALDETRTDGALALTFPYFEGPALRWEEAVTYTEPKTVIDQPVTYSWNHGLGEIMTALLDAGLVIEAFREYQFCEWQALPWMVQGDDGRWRLPEKPERAPLMYSIRARKA
jgi:SAM-dependent methyltransferase